MKKAIKRYLRRSVLAYPDPLQWWAYILNATKGNFSPLLEGYEGDIVKIHKAITDECDTGLFCGVIPDSPEYLQKHREWENGIEESYLAQLDRDQPHDREEAGTEGSYNA